jgi:hypothetical protein
MTSLCKEDSLTRRDIKQVGVVMDILRLLEYWCRPT